MAIRNLKFEKKALRDSIADKLEEMILNEEVKVGSKIPSEIELAASFGVSRNVLREALNILKERGMVSGKAGDGTYIVKPEPMILSKMVGRLITLNDLSYENIFDVRLSLEVLGAGLAAENSTEEDLVEMDTLISEMGENINDVSKYIETVFRLHIAIAEASKNLLIPTIMEPLHTVLLRIFSEGYSVDQNDKNGLVEDHRKLVELIRNKDKRGTEKLMKEHILNSKRKVFRKSSS
ncbi:MAG: FadR/GntR family transcriptional regulator [Sphaerochaetaceae bacterium]|nr:FadR/GntR family transcriptional regulator [Sphaerochaetaceae bacterium]